MLSNDYHNILMIVIVSLVYMFISKETVKEVQKSSTALHIMHQMNNLILTYKFFNFLNFTVIRQMEAQDRLTSSLVDINIYSMIFYFFIAQQNH